MMNQIATVGQKEARKVRKLIPLGTTQAPGERTGFIVTTEGTAARGLSPERTIKGEGL